MQNLGLFFIARDETIHVRCNVNLLIYPACVDDKRNYPSFLLLLFCCIKSAFKILAVTFLSVTP